MEASDLPTRDVALADFVVEMGRARAARRCVEVRAIGVLWYSPSPDGGLAVWRCIDRQSTTCGPVMATIEVLGEREPGLVQVAHYIQARRLARRYASQSVRTLAGLVSATAGQPLECQADEFILDSIRIPPRPWHGDVWRLRWRHPLAAGRVLELAYIDLEPRAAHVYGDGSDVPGLSC